MKNFEIKQHIPDSLNKDCDIIFEALKRCSNTNIDYQIELLRQCIEYLDMEYMYFYYEKRKKI